MLEDHNGFFEKFAEEIIDGDRVGIVPIHKDLPFSKVLQTHRHEYYELRVRLDPESAATICVEVIYPRVCHFMLPLEEHDHSHIWTLVPDAPEFHHPRNGMRGPLSPELVPMIVRTLEQLRDEPNANTEKELRLMLALMALRRPVLQIEKLDSCARISMMIKKLRAHYYRPDLSISSEAAAIGYSPNYVQKQFFKIQGCSPKDFLTTVRMDAAAKFLREQRYPQKQIALMCGYRYLSYFSRAFRNYYGCTPGKFAKIFAEQSAAEKTGGSGEPNAGGGYDAAQLNIRQLPTQ